MKMIATNSEKQHSCEFTDESKAKYLITGGGKITLQGCWLIKTASTD
jgi:hypothetical protein